MHKTTLYLDDDLYAQMQRMAQATGQTQASVIREAVAIYLASAAKKAPRSVGMGKSGDLDFSAKSEELLTGFGES